MFARLDQNDRLFSWEWGGGRASHWSPSCFYVLTDSTPSQAHWGTLCRPKKLILRCETLGLCCVGHFASLCPLRMTPGHTWSHAASPSSLVLPESYSLCLKPPPGTPWIPRDFPWPVESSSVWVNMNVTCCSPASPRHPLLIVVVQLQSDLRLLWL